MIVLSFTVRGDFSLVVVGTFDFTIVVTPCFYRVHEPAYRLVSGHACHASYNLNTSIKGRSISLKVVGTTPIGELLHTIDNMHSLKP